MLKSKIFLLLFLLSIKILCLNIIPNGNIPIMVNRPYLNFQNQNISISFTLTSNSLGLYPKQYIAIQFPQIAGSTLRLDKENRFSCTLAGDDSIVYLVNSESSSQLESYIAFCRLDDVKNVKAGSYKLTLQIKNCFFSFPQSLSTIGIFLCTSTNKSRIIIDSNPTFGSSYLFRNFQTGFTSPAPLDFTNVSPSVNPLNFGVTFDLIVNLKVNSNSYISKNSLIIIKWGKNSVTPPISCTFPVISSNNPLQLGLYGNLMCYYSESQDDLYIYLKGLNEDLIGNREFQIVLKGMQVKPFLPSSPELLEVIVFYKNTNIIFSYASNPIFKINPPTFSSTSINHPEGWDIYQGGSFPLQFNFALSSELKQGSVVLIQQVETDPSIKKWNFIASTCDFSNNDVLFDHSYGNRPICIPLRNDLNYPLKNNGSGIYFKLPYISSGKTYSIRVFGFAEKCGSEANTFMRGTNNVQFSFVFSLYSSINMLGSNENRLLLTNNNLFSISSPTTMTNFCWGTLNGSGNSFKQNIFDDSIYNASTDSILLSEFYDFKFGIAQSSSCNSNPSTCFLSDCTNTVNFQEGFLLTENVSKSINNSFFLFKADILQPDSSSSLRNTIPMPLIINSSTPVYHPGKIIFQINKNWLQPGDNINSSCYISWGGFFSNLSNGIYSSISGTPTQTILNNITSNPSLNFISQTGSSPLIDSSSSIFLPSGSTLKIISSVDSTGNTSFKYLADANSKCGSSCNNYSLSIFSTCMKWASKFEINSTHNYLDFEILYVTTKFGNPGNINRINRFFKFITELYALNDPLKQINVLNGFVNFHISYFSSPMNTNYNSGLCLVQINNLAISQNIDQKNNIILVYLSNLILLEMDYNDLTSIYPISPFTENLTKSYGLNSAPIADYTNNIFSHNIYNLYYHSMSYSGKSTYNMFLSSFVLIIDLPKILSNDLLIPVYCPVFRTGLLSSISFAPSASVVLGNSNSWKSFQIKSLIATNKSAAILSGSGFTFQQFASVNTNISIASLFPSASLKFSSLNSPINNILYIIPYPPDKRDHVNCSGFVFLLDKMINFETTVSISTFSRSGFKNYNSSFYALGKKFNHAILFGLNSQVQIKTNPYDFPGSQATFNSLNISGIIRPNLSDLLISASNIDYVSTNDRIAFYCMSLSFDNFYLSNLSQTSSIKSFILDYILDTSAVSVKMSKEENNENFLNDIAGKIKLSVNSSFIISKYLLIRFKLDSLGENSFCGIKNPLEYLNNCNLNDGIIECSVPIDSKSIDICCYNIPFISNIINLNSFQLVLLSSSITGSVLYTNYISNLERNSSFLFTNNNKFIPNNKFVVINSLTYSQANNEGGIGKASFSISLNRSPVRDSIIRISGDFKQNSKLNGLKHKCKATFNDLGISDILIDFCSLNFISVPNLITIHLKKISMKCSIPLKQNLIINIYPYYIVNYKSNDYFTTSMTLFQSEEKLVLDSKNQTISVQNDYLMSNKSFVSNYQDFLFKLNIFPKVADSIADYIFSIELNRYLNKISDILINEISLIFPVLYPEFISNLICNLNGYPINCMVYDSFLNLEFPFNYDLIGIPKLNLKISGLRNPNTKKDLVFGVTLNNLNKTSNIRLNLVCGTTTVSRGINDDNYLSKNIGYLKISQVYSQINYYNSLTQIKLKVGFETTLNTTVLPLSLSDPIFFISLPLEYNFVRNLNQVKLNIEEYYGSNTSIQPLINKITGGTVITGGSNIKYIFNNLNKIIGSNFLLWDVTITFTNPELDLVPSGLFQITLTNKELSYIYRSIHSFNFFNMTTFANTQDFFLFYFKEINFQYKTNKFIIDIVCDKINEITIHVGQFTNCSFSIRNRLEPKNNALSVNVTLNDQQFFTELPSYTIQVNNVKKDFLIGVNCSEYLPRVYYISFLLDDNENFYISNVKVNLINSKPLLISLPNTVLDVPKNGSISFPIKLDKFNSEIIKLSFFQIFPSIMTKDSKIQDVFINPASIQNLVTLLINPLKFRSGKNIIGCVINKENSCYKIDSIRSIITINISSSVSYPEITNSENLINFSINQTNSSLPKNTVVIYIKPSFAPCHIYTVIYSSELNPPSDFEIMNFNNSKYKYDKSIVSYNYRFLFEIKEENFRFDNLERGKTYYLKLILKSVENPKPLYEKSLIFTSIVNRETNKNMILTLIPVQPTSCAIFKYNYYPLFSLQKNLINYCQTSISKFNPSNGCLFCSDNNGNLPKGIATYQSLIKKNEYQQTSFPSQNFTHSSTYHLCISQDLLCPNDPTFSIEDTLNNFLKDLGSNKDINLKNGIFFTSINKFNDRLPLDISFLPKNIISTFFSITGEYSITINGYSDLKCFWLINTNKKISPTFSELKVCNYEYCGNTILFKGRKNEIKSANLKSFEYDIHYYVWIGCYHNIPYPTKFSNVIHLTEFMISKN